MSYMQEYERALNKARNKASGGEMSEVEKENVRIELGMDSREDVLSCTSSVSCSLGLGTKPGFIDDK